MTPEEKALLQETHDLAAENTRILRGIERSQRIGRIFQIIYWVLIIGLSFGAFYLIQPYINALQGSLSDIGGTPAANAVNPFSISGTIKDIQQVQKLYSGN